MLNKTSFQELWRRPDLEWDGHHDICVSHHLMTGGYITVLSRMTGYGYRDVETGYRSPCGQFWLASGNMDIRDELHKLNSEDAMVDWVIKNANICKGGHCDRCPSQSYKVFQNGGDV